MPDPTDAGPDEAALADSKAKMREALERKREKEHMTAEGRRNTGSVHGSEVTGAEGKRVFRRKSG
ncbi:MULTISPECIES: DUF5302 domain-containing protein [Occultella]|uniref:DUF5302 domain-containing protein n=1 Tax=Occultella gossypii TaxID=2800820 RepID=A0ABS7SFV5_9MICO|nr:MULTISPECIES: DUF5302 domain-containing protein [Occultella]MBZ2199232.1 DUF5302 domain-containing protein [Occultella gossypii]